MNSAVCGQHNNPYAYISFNASKAQLICEQCFLTRIDTAAKQDETIIDFKKAFHSPAYLLSKTILSEDFTNIFEYLTKNDEYELKRQSVLLEKQIRLLQGSLDTVIKEVNDYISFMISLRKQLMNQLQQAIKLDDFEQFINEWNSNNSNPDIIQQLENQCFKYYQSISSQISECSLINNINNQEFIKQIKLCVKSYSLQIKKFPKIICPQMHLQFNLLVNNFNQGYNDFFCQTLPEFYNYTDLQDKSNLLTISFASKLNNLIEEKSNKIIKSSNAVNLGSRDGLNCKGFWNKANGKSNLLIVCKSNNNNYVFGGYSPCQWEKCGGKYVQDDTLTSFLFSQTRNKIYPLKQDRKQYAICCNSNYGPTFGGGHDMYLLADFTKGYQNLGHSYQWDESNDTSKDQLFGGAQPNVSECEIYELTFV